MSARKLALPLTLAGLCAALCLPVAAQQALGPDNRVSEDDADLPVLSRLRPEFDPKGIPFGGFRVFPLMTVSGSYDNNIDRQDTGIRDDFIVDLAPTIRVQSQWAEDSLEIYAGANSYNYLAHGEENLTDWDTGLDGRYYISHEISVYGTGQAAEFHEQRSSPNTLGAQESALQYYQYHGEANVAYQPNRFNITLGGIIDSFNYQDVGLVGGGTLDNADRNYEDYQAYAKASYEFSPGYSGFFRALYDKREYDLQLDRSGANRSSNGYRLDAGVDLQLTHLISGEVYAGYMEQSFKAPLSDIRGIDYNAKLDWLIDPLVTLHLQGTRTLSQTTLPGVSASEDSSVTLSADYEFRRNILVLAHASYLESTFPGSDRQDTVPDVGVNVNYLFDRHLSAQLSYDYSERNSNAPGVNFKDHLITLAITAHD
jgi:hypothetical protein